MLVLAARSLALARRPSGREEIMDSADTSSSTTAEDGGGNLGSIDIIFGAQ